MKEEIFVGKILYCKNGKTCVINSIEEKNITVKYEGKIYERPKSIIGDKLYVKPLKHAEEEELDNKYNCSNCMKQKSEECYGLATICEDFQYCPTLENEKKYWPEYGDATYLRLHSKRKGGRN